MVQVYFKLSVIAMCVFLHIEILCAKNLAQRITARTVQ